MIFNLGFSQRCLTGKAPVDRLFAAKEAFILSKLAAFPGDDGFILIIHRQIRVFPVSHNSQAFKLISLNINEFFSILPAKPPNISQRKVFLFLPDFNIHVMLNGKPVAVPARHINRIIAGHLFGANDDIFQNFVQSGSDMDIAVGVRGTIM